MKQTMTLSTLLGLAACAFSQTYTVTKIEAVGTASPQTWCNLSPAAAGGEGVSAYFSGTRLNINAQMNWSNNVTSSQIGTVQGLLKWTFKYTGFGTPGTVVNLQSSTNLSLFSSLNAAGCVASELGDETFGPMSVSGGSTGGNSAKIWAGAAIGDWTVVTPATSTTPGIWIGHATYGELFSMSLSVVGPPAAPNNCFGQYFHSLMVYTINGINITGR